MHDPDIAVFAVCTYVRVFDTEPLQEVWTLEDLVGRLLQFEVRSEVKAAVDRELARIDTALDAWQQGRVVAGKHASDVRAAARDAERDGQDPSAAVAERVEALRKDARREAKRFGLRHWSPTWLVEGARKRGTESVEHLSCLVLDYDAGATVEDAHAHWEAWFHVVHTTWSHTPEHPKFHVVLPLARPVWAADWPAVWSWAEERAQHKVDPTGKGLARMYALPAVGDAQQPREALSSPGPLLDPVIEGLVSRSAPMPAQRPVPPAEPTHTTVGPEEDDDGWELDPLGGTGPAEPLPPEPARPTPPPSQTAVGAALESRVAALETRVEELEVLLRTLVLR